MLIIMSKEVQLLQEICLEGESVFNSCQYVSGIWISTFSFYIIRSLLKCALWSSGGRSDPNMHKYEELPLNVLINIAHSLLSSLLH